MKHDTSQVVDTLLQENKCNNVQNTGKKQTEDESFLFLSLRGSKWERPSKLTGPLRQVLKSWSEVMLFSQTH